MKKRILSTIIATLMLLAVTLPAAAASGEVNVFSLAIAAPESNSIPISNGEQLRRIGRTGDLPATANYHLTADIHLADGAWTPIRNFSGIFDGQGYIIRNLTVVETRASGGMFETLSSAAVVRNLGLEDVSININGYGDLSIDTDASGATVGGITGYGGSVINSYVTGVVSVTTTGNTDSSVHAYAGGISGGNSNVSNSFSMAAVSATANLEGRSASGNDAEAYEGGIVGYNAAGFTVENSHGAGTVAASSRNTSGSRFSSYAGGICGYGEDGAVFRNTFWNIDSNQTVNGVPLTNDAKKGLAHGTGDVTELTDTQMRTQSSFTEFNFNSVWAVMPGVNNGFPGLRAFGAFPSTWAEADIIRAAELGLVPETLQSRYRDATTRAEFAALAVALYETVTRREIEIGDNPFTDTRDVNAIKAAEIRVTSGTGDGTTFSPDAPLTREQAATMLSRLATAVARPLRAQAPDFADSARISAYAIEAIGQMQATGIMRGDGERFNPQDPYTREQSIMTILRLYDAVR